MQIAIKLIANVPECEVLQMLALHRQYYSNVKQEKFFADFREKTWCIVVADDDGQVQGYSTLQLIPTVRDQPNGTALRQAPGFGWPLVWRSEDTGLVRIAPDNPSAG